MTGWQILGLVIVALVFIGIGNIIVRDVGWRGAAFIGGFAFATTAVLILAALLIAGELP